MPGDLTGQSRSGLFLCGGRFDHRQGSQRQDHGGSGAQRRPMGLGEQRGLRNRSTPGRSRSVSADRTPSPQLFLEIHRLVTGVPTVGIPAFRDLFRLPAVDRKAPGERGRRGIVGRRGPSGWHVPCATINAGIRTYQPAKFGDKCIGIFVDSAGWGRLRIEWL